jgi:hypothetical protein
MFGPRHDDRRKKPSLFRRLMGLVLALIGSGGVGLGGWQLRDHPMLQQVIQIVGIDTTKNVTGEGLKDRLIEGLAEAVESRSLNSPGVFRVQVSDLQVDSALFSKRQPVELHVRVLRLRAGEDEKVVWSSKPFGSDRLTAGESEITSSWEEHPFEVSWKSGDQYQIEVWNVQGRRPEQLFSMITTSLDEFPLKSGTQSFVRSTNTRATINPANNHITFASRRIGEIPPAEEPSRLTRRSPSGSGNTHDPVIIR